MPETRKNTKIFKSWYDSPFRISQIKKAKKKVPKGFRTDLIDVTKNYIRFRQKNPKNFSEFRIKEINSNLKFVMGKNKKTGEWEVQSIMVRKE